MVAPAGLEPTAYGLGNRRSILLSYGANLTFRNRLLAQLDVRKPVRCVVDRRLTQPVAESRNFPVRLPGTRPEGRRVQEYRDLGVERRFVSISRSIGTAPGESR